MNWENMENINISMNWTHHFLIKSSKSWEYGELCDEILYEIITSLKSTVGLFLGIS